jgi:hypothetical protein
MLLFYIHSSLSDFGKQINSQRSLISIQIKLLLKEQLVWHSSPIFLFGLVNLMNNFIANLVSISNTFLLASFILNTPYYMYYNQRSNLENLSENNSNVTTFINENKTIVMYCYASFPSQNMEKALTIYTVIISYVLPLLTIIFCYARMIGKIVNKSSEKEIFEMNGSSSISRVHMPNNSNNSNINSKVSQS